MSSSPLRVLLVEDNRVDASLVLGRMQRFDDMRLHWVESLAGCQAFLGVHGADAVLLDLTLGDAAGTALIDSVREVAGDAAIVILTGNDDEETGLLALRHGCQDFLVKGRCDGPLIRQTILHSLVRHRLERARLAAEEKARQGEQLADMILHTAPEAMLVIDRDDVVVRANAHAGMVFGHGTQTLIGKKRALLLPDCPDTGGACVGLRIDGSTVAVRVEVNALRFGDDDYRILGIRDLSALQAAEAEQRLHGEIFAHVQEGVVIADPDGTILAVNPAFCRLSGYDEDELVGSPASFLHGGHHHTADHVDPCEMLRRDGHWTGEIWYRHRDGDVTPHWVSLSAVRDDQGEVSNFVGVYMDISTLKRHEDALRHMAHHDALTGLPNRVLLADRLTRALERGRRNGRMVAVAYVDLDGFKPVNDRLGHHVGDSVLIQVGQRLRDAVGDDDTVARLGGDEYVLILQDVADQDQCRHLVERVLNSVAAPMVVGENGQTQTITASVGVALFPRDDSDPDTLLRHADRAMYQAKQDGRNRFVLFDPQLDLDHGLRHDAMRSLRAALDAGQFVLFYQPKVNMRLGQVVGAEALIRWLHPERGLLPPAEFLPLVDDDALDCAIGEWVVRTSLAQMRAWKRQGAVIPVSVNIAAGHLLSPGFAEKLGRLLRQFPEVPPRMLQIEVVETAALEDVARARDVLEQCRHLGVSVALDDFGTGYSSLTYLRNLPIDTLKIDRSFVCNLPDDNEDLAIVQGVIVMANGFGRTVLAEGVEKAEHGDMLLSLGCELGQGYRIAPPMPADDFLGWIEAWRPDASWAASPSRRL
ncbi:MAG: EAL domain-containing protein [Magnetospirillum sp.]|nr:EAL domain-containing protein [Magnetospirillum sp.]